MRRGECGTGRRFPDLVSSKTPGLNPLDEPRGRIVSMWSKGRQQSSFRVYKSLWKRTRHRRKLARRALISLELVNWSFDPRERVNLRKKDLFFYKAMTNHRSVSPLWIFVTPLCCSHHLPTTSKRDTRKVHGQKSVKLSLLNNFPRVFQHPAQII